MKRRDFIKAMSIGAAALLAPGLTQAQAKQNIKDSVELFYSDIMRAGLYRNQPDLVRALVNGAKDAFEWTKSYLGVPYLDKIEIFGGHSVPRCFAAFSF